MAIKASSSTIRDMNRDISSAINDINAINDIIKKGLSATSGWNDSQSKEFNSIMLQIAQLVSSPLDTLHSATPKLEKLAYTLDNYNNVKF